MDEKLRAQLAAIIGDDQTMAQAAALGRIAATFIAAAVGEGMSYQAALGAWAGYCHGAMMPGHCCATHGAPPQPT